MVESRTLSISIDRDWRQVYDAMWRPQNFSRWASGLSRSPLKEDGAGWWKTEGPEGPIRIRFTGRNDFGVMDHTVDIGGGAEVYVPMRVVANGKGAEILFTLFRESSMSDEKFAADAEWVARDLIALKAAVASTL